ncbi:MAG: phosphoribosylformylglycinamidine synthase subunit PurQ [Alphaproteobacteria bacterium]|nr:phosphoribosylformylglycinamidine synthase subunit PurQ [Alphaproteobacteria bacterium]
MKAAVITFPASNCDRDARVALKAITGKEPVAVWHGDSELPKVDFVMIPGGFSYGDYLRCGAMAAHSPIMREVKAHADRGGYVLGVCNGFQILSEAGMLDGTLMRNASLRFVCKNVFLKAEAANTPFTSGYGKKPVIRIPVAHHDGNYFAAPDVLKRLEGNGQIAFRYCTPEGKIEASANPNGSLGNIAGILNGKKNVLGMMPHPERHADPLTGGVDGRILFESLIQAIH